MRVDLARVFVVASLVSLTAAIPRLARADEPTHAERAASDAIFDEARALFDQGKIKEALVKFEASNTLDPTAGKLLNIARCHENLGQFASAFGALDVAEAMARKNGDAERESFAKEHKRELEPKLSRLKIEIEPDAHVKNVTLDGKTIPPGALGVAILIDARKYELTADRDGAEPYRVTLDVTQPGTTTARIPKAAKATPPPPPPYWNTQRIGAASLGGFGVAGIVVGAIFGLRAGDAMDASDPHCWESTPDLCDSEGVALRDRATREAWISNIGIGVGAASIVGGIILFATASPKPTEKSGKTLTVLPVVGAGSGGALAIGRF